MLDSYLYNLPSSEKQMFAISQALKGQKTSNNKAMENVVYWEQWRSTYVFDFVLTFKPLRKFAKNDYCVRPVYLTIGEFVGMERLVPQWTDL